MKHNIFKRGLIFVLLIALVFSSTSFAFATDMESIKLNNTTLNFNKIVYVDATNGNDTNGDGSNLKPFAGLRKAMDYLCDNNLKIGVAIVISDGDYDWSSIATGYSYNIDNKFNGMKVSFISKNLGKTLIHSNNGFEFSVVEDDPASRIKLSFYGVIFHNSTIDGLQLSSDDWNNEYYNCVFRDVFVGGWNGIVSTACAKVENCIFKDCMASSTYTQNPIIGEAVNCVSTNETLDPSNGKKTTCLTNATVDDSYNITSGGWKNAGTGTNPDGSVANLGVYGGTFAWNYSAIKSTNLQAASGDSNVSLTWDKVDGATSYNVKRSTTKGGPYTNIATGVTDTKYTDSAVSNGTTYYYVVSAVTSSGEGSNSNEATATPQKVVSSSRAILDIRMNDGSTKEYRLTSDELTDFLTWYESRSRGEAKAFYTFPVKGDVSPFSSVNDYIPFDKILSFDVKAYS